MGRSLKEMVQEKFNSKPADVVENNEEKTNFDLLLESVENGDAVNFDLFVTLTESEQAEIIEKQKCKVKEEEEDMEGDYEDDDEDVNEAKDLAPEKDIVDYAKKSTRKEALAYNNEKLMQISGKRRDAYKSQYEVNRDYILDTFDEDVNEAKKVFKYKNGDEKVEVTKKTKNGKVMVIYSDGSEGWEHPEDLLD